jgi:hypothetical protein
MNPMLLQAPVLLFAGMALSFIAVLGSVTLADVLRRQD